MVKEWVDTFSHLFSRLFSNLSHLLRLYLSVHFQIITCILFQPEKIIFWWHMKKLGNMKLL